MKALKKIILLFVIIPLLISCGGGSDGDDGGGSGTSLAGTWVGTLEDGTGVLHSLTVTLGSNTSITSIVIDGTNQNMTGTITAVSSSINAKLFSFVLSDTTEGGFFADPSLNYIAYVDEDFSFGVLQKEAGGLPTYTSSDIVGSWAGYSIELNSNFDISAEYFSVATVQTSGSFTDVASLPSGDLISTGAFSSYYPNYGKYVGNYSNTVDSGTISAFLSVDKRFSASWGCAGAFPTNCSFSAWVK